MALLDDHAGDIRQACDELTNVIREAGEEISLALNDIEQEIGEPDAGIIPDRESYRAVRDLIDDARAAVAVNLR